MPEFLVPFKGREKPCNFGVNFLWHERNVYIMDNHRCALWCWLQEIPGEDKVSLFHVDAHYDLAWDWCPVALDVVRRVNLVTLPIDEYLALEIPGAAGTRAAVIDDNFLSLFLVLYPGRTDNLRVTSGPEFCGDLPTEEIRGRVRSFDRVGPRDLQYRARTDLERGSRWVFDLDLDFFFCQGKSEKELMPLFSDRYAEALFETIAEGLRREQIAVLTVSLSPEFCGGWPNSEKVCSSLCEALGLDFGLPV